MRLENAGLLAHVGEGAVAVVVIKDVRESVKGLGRTNVRRLVGLVVASRMLLERPVDVVADVEIGKAVTIEVRPGSARAPLGIAKASFLGDVDKAAAAFAFRLILKKRNPAPAGDQQIGPAVVVVIRHGAAVGVEPVDL